MTQFSDRLARSVVRELTPYPSARRLGGVGDVWLNANEYPLAVPYDLTEQNLNRYPSCQPEKVIQAYANYAGVSSKQVMVCRGADEAIELIIRTFCEPGQDSILYCPPTYGMYDVSAESYGVKRIIVPLTPEWQLDIPKITAELLNCKLLFICSPNNPTGSLIAKNDIAYLLQQTRHQALVVVDEAYIEFCAKATLVRFLAEYPHLIILRTLSKAFALAGLRCGFALANPEVIQLMLKVIAPYPLASPVADIASQALRPVHIELMQKRVRQLNQFRDQLALELAKLSNVITVYPSAANWLLVKFSNVQSVFSQLSEQGIVVRHQQQSLGLTQCLRITIGTESESVRLLAVLQSIADNWSYHDR